MVVPGATEQMTFGDLDSPPGFVFMELEPGRPPALRHVEVRSQPRRRVAIPTAELEGADPSEALKTRLEAICDREAMVRVSLEGPISRQRYHDLKLREVGEFGSARSFFLDLDTSGLYLEDEQHPPAARGGRLSQREELTLFARECREAAGTEEERELIEEATRAILEEYR